MCLRIGVTQLRIRPHYLSGPMPSGASWTIFLEISFLVIVIRLSYDQMDLSHMNYGG